MKQRLDILLLEKGLVSSREKAKRLINEGVVFTDGHCRNKAGILIDTEAEIEIKENAYIYVSRGGLKLEKALKLFEIDLNHKICMDIGASTGGFTDCMLKSGAAKVYAIDVGTDQLDPVLRKDPRVISMENTNIRHLKAEDIADVPEFSGIDVSFISLEKVLPAVTGLLSEEGRVMALIKPQFEAGKNKVGKNGVVKDPAVHVDVISTIIQLSLSLRLYVLGLSFSPIKGPSGNIEYLIYLRKARDGDILSEDEVCKRIDIRSIVKESHESL